MKKTFRNNSRVTVIIPCYNDGIYIDEAVNSILSQTYSNYEIIIVDDGSNDQTTVNKLKQYKCSNIKVLFKSNGGVSSARNYGVRHTNSEYILFLDADDIFDSTFLEKAVNILDNRSEIGVVTCYARYFVENDFNKTTDVWRPKGGGVENFLVENNAVGNSLVRHVCWKDAGGYDETLLSSEDRDFWIKITKNGWIIHAIPEILFHYRRAAKSKYWKFKNQRPEIIKHIVSNNVDVYSKYVVECLYEKEKELYYYKRKVDEVQNKLKKSPPYIIGYYITYPNRKIRKLLKVIRSKLVTFLNINSG